MSSASFSRRLEEGWTGGRAAPFRGGFAVAAFLFVGCGGRGTAVRTEDGSIPKDGGIGVDACASSARCNPNGNLCRTGTTSCVSGTAACVGVTNVARGTACGANQVCADGSCVACVSGTSCSPEGNACKVGVLSCSSGSSTCGSLGNAPNGTACGAGDICLDGACTACMEGAACSPGGNACQTGTISCSTGQAVCVAIGDVAEGTSCSAGICCGGVCAACDTPPNATATCSGTVCGFSCTAGFTLCAGSCADTSSDSQACGPSCTVCPTGSTCNGSACSDVFEYGQFTAYSPCEMNGSQSAESGLLLGERVYIASAIQVTALGVIATSAEPTTGIDGILALYDDEGGLPLALQAQTASTTIGPGDNLIPVVSPVSVASGTYWIMSEYDVAASVCVDDSASNPIAYVAISAYDVVPALLTNPQVASSVDVNYYVVGQ